MLIGGAVINGADIAAEYCLYGFIGIHGDMQVARQTVPRSKRDDSQDCIRVHQGFRHLVYRTVPSGSEHVSEFVFHRLFGYFSGVSRITGNSDNDIEFSLIESGCHFFGNIFLRFCSRYRIDYDTNAGLFHNLLFCTKIR
ncbi:hypothetical protein SDC9_120881 [bioreactor metagenome]|uniref:Uncharacterized protein n=1 Tax=bioreactor metagenome TaxID=1076179 RepID=A0A645CAD7_9ZZZZ